GGAEGADVNESECGPPAERTRAMRKRYRVLLLAAIVAAFVVPVGFALSLESGAVTPHVQYRAPVATTTHLLANAPVLVPVPSPTPASESPSVPDGVKLFAVGTALVGLAAVVRRAV